MGAAIAAQSGVIGGQQDPAFSHLDNSITGPFNGKWMPIPPGYNTAETWFCVGYHHDGASPPVHTWVAFAKVYAGEHSVTINGTTFDLDGVVPGEWMLYTAYGDGTTANPWTVSYALSVFRGTSGALGDDSLFPVQFAGNGIAYAFTTSLGITTVSTYGITGTPFPCTYDTVDGPIYDPLGINNGDTSNIWCLGGYGFGSPPGKAYTFFTIPVNAGVTYLPQAWKPDGLGATGTQPPNSWFQSQGVGQQWGLPDELNLVCREISANDQLSTSIPLTMIASGGLKNFFVQVLAQDYLDGDLTGIAARLAAEGGTGFSGNSHGVNDMLAEKVRPDFIDQELEASGGIFLYS